MYVGVNYGCGQINKLEYYGCGQIISVFFCRSQNFFGRASLRQDTEPKELLYCGKCQTSWLFMRQADTVAVLKSTVKQDNKK